VGIPRYEGSAEGRGVGDIWVAGDGGGLVDDHEVDIEGARDAVHEVAASRAADGGVGPKGW